MDKQLDFPASLSFSPREQATRRQYASLRTVSREDLLKELEVLYVNLFQVLSRSILDAKVLTGYRLPADEEELSPDQLPDLKEFAGASVLLAFRAYAIDGETPSEDLVYSLPDIGSFVALILALGYHGDVELPTLSLRVYHTAVARLKLDSQTKFPWMQSMLPSGELYLSDMALLAGMSERSVRNATLATANDPLKTLTVGNRVLVAPDEALPWLRRRKAFIETKKGA